MNFQTAIQTCFEKFATFSGRAARSEFWYFVLFTILGSAAAGIVDGLFFGFGPEDPSRIASLFSLVVLIPTISVTVRRLHDQNRSGWWYWLFLIPLIGWIILLVWYATAGTPGPNDFGSDPLDGNSAADDTSAMSRSSVPRVRGPR